MKLTKSTSPQLLAVQFWRRSVARRHLLRVASLTWLFLRVALATCIGVWVGFAAVWEVGARWL